MHTMEPELIPMSEDIISTMNPESLTAVRTAIRDLRTHYETMFMEKGMKINYLAFRLEREKFIRHGWEKPA